MEVLQHSATIIASLAAFLAPPVIVAAGVVPRAGPLRALVLGLSSRLFLRANPVSQRTNEVAALRLCLSAEDKDFYSIVTGPKGVGKTCVVDTATEATFGVVSVDVAPGKPFDTILTDVFTAISNTNPRVVEPHDSARRVLRWHRFIFRTPVTVVLRGIERKPTQQFADLDGAAKAMAHNLGIRVVIDASDNSLPENAKRTKREDVIEVDPMPRSVLESVPELSELLSALKGSGLADIVWECVGGVPADYLRLFKKWKKAGRGTGSELEAVVEPFLTDLLDQAIRDRDANVVANPRLKELYALFVKQAEVPHKLLQESQLARPSPDKVLRIRRSPRGTSVLVPANGPTAVVLRFALIEPPALWELKNILHNSQPLASPAQ